MRTVLCVMCRCRIEGEKVKHGKGWRHPECTKPARDALPDRPLSPGEAEEEAIDDKETARHSHLYPDRG